MMRANLWAVAVTALGVHEAGALAAEELAQGGWAAVEGLGRPAQRLGGAIGTGAGLRTGDLAAGDLVVGAQMQPGGEVPGIGKAREVRSEFREQGEGSALADARYQRQVGAEQLREVGSEVEATGCVCGWLLGGRVSGRFLGAGCRRWLGRTKRTDGGFNLLITLADELLVMATCRASRNTALASTTVSGSENVEERAVGEQMRVFFPNQAGRGAHVNVSGAGITASSKNLAGALSLLEFLAGETAQRVWRMPTTSIP